MVARSSCKRGELRTMRKAFWPLVVLVCLSSAPSLCSPQDSPQQKPAAAAPPPVPPAQAAKPRIEPPQVHEFVIANFKTESGVTLPQARVVYGTYGRLKG